MTNFLKLTGSFGINLYSLNMKFHEKIFTTIIIIQLWNFGNFGISEIIPKSLVTLRFSKISLHELKISCKTFQMRHWPNFYFDPAYSNAWLTCNATLFKTNAHNCKCILKYIRVYNVYWEILHTFGPAFWPAFDEEKVLSKKGGPEVANFQRL